MFSKFLCVSASAPLVESVLVLMEKSDPVLGNDTKNKFIHEWSNQPLELTFLQEPQLDDAENILSDLTKNECGEKRSGTHTKDDCERDANSFRKSRESVDKVLRKFQHHYGLDANGRNQIRRILHDLPTADQALLKMNFRSFETVFDSGADESKFTELIQVFLEGTTNLYVAGFNSKLDASLQESVTPDQRTRLLIRLAIERIEISFDILKKQFN